MKRAKKIRPIFFKPNLTVYVSNKLREYAASRNGKCFKYARPQLRIKP